MALEYGLTDEQYDAKDGIRKSDLDLVAISPLHYHTRRAAKREDTPAFRFGRLLHCFALEPDLVSDRFVVAPDINKRTNAGKAEWEEFQAMAADRGLTCVTQDDMGLAETMADSLRDNKIFARLMRNAMIETSFFAPDPETGLMRKARPDAFNPKEAVILDVKTTQSAIPWAFSQSVYQYRYHVQDPYYSDVVSTVTHEPVRGFVFAAIEKEPPHPVAIFALDERAVELGTFLWKRELLTIKRCQETGEWPGYDPKIRVLSLPRYAYNGND